MKSQERVTVKTTYAGDREPDYAHWAADSYEHPEAKKALAYYRAALKSKTLEVVKVEIYRELMLYTQTLWERWEKEPSADSESDGTP